MTADDLHIDEKTPRGTRVLRDYLAYAKAGGRLEEQSVPTGREPDSDFEVSVAAALRRHGYEVVPQIGVAGYFIDLAVRDPRRPGAYLLGVECDGATYHRSHSARDRDRLRQSVLEGLGWKIHRVWSTDWFKQPGQEVAKLVTRLQALAQNAMPHPAAPPPPDPPPQRSGPQHPIPNPRPPAHETTGNLFADANRRIAIRLPYDKARKSYRDWTDRLVADCRFGRSVGEEMVKWAVTGLQMGLESRSLSFLAGLEMPLDQEETANLFMNSAQELGVPHAT